MQIPDFLIEEKKNPPHIKDVTNTTQLINNVKPLIVTDNIKQEDILNIIEKYWQNRGLSNSYQTGVLLGKGDISNIQLKEFFRKFKQCLESIVRSELTSQDKTSEEFKDDFKALEHLFFMISTHMEKSGIKLENEKFLSILNGFINSYVTSIKYE